MSNSFGGSTVGTNYRGNRAFQPPNWAFEKRDPTPYDTLNFEVGDLWMNKKTKLPWILVSLSGSPTSKGELAKWIQFASATGLLTSLTSNDNVTVYGDVNQNIFTVGDGTTITGVGNAGTHTITFSVVGGRAAQSFVATSPVTTPTDTGGTATPILGVINVQASHNLSVSAGTPNTGAANDIVYWTTNTSTWGDLVDLTAGNFAVQAFTGDITITANNGVGNLNLPTTVISGNAGVVTQGGTGFANRLLHTYGTHNIFLGELAGNTTLTVASATANIGIGFEALSSLTNSFGNVCIGAFAGAAINSGETNIAIGAQSLSAETAGAQNIAIGTQCMFNAIGCFQNTAVGTQALLNLQNGTLNTCVGHNAGTAYGAAGESNNTIFGPEIGVVGEFNTIRIHVNNSAPNNNIFIGQGGCGEGITVANAVQNVCVGAEAFTTLSTGQNNVAVGHQALRQVTTGNSNTAIGITSCLTLTTGSNNVCLGQSSGLNYVGAESSNILIGNTGVAAESNVIRIGGATGTGAGQQNYCNISGIRGITTGTNNAIAVLIDSTGQLGTVSSSARYKENIHPIADSSDALYKLKPVQFNYKSHSHESISFGLIAEEVAHVMPRLVVYDEKKHPETVKYLDLIPLLLNELQKLNERVKLLEK